MRLVVFWCHQCVQEMGNAKAKRLYEAFLPECFQRPETDQSAESFIRDKYDKKKYMDKVIDIQMLRVSPHIQRESLCSKLDRQTGKSVLSKVIPPEVSATTPLCSLCTERKELRQYTQGTSCVWEDEIGECIIPRSYWLYQKCTCPEIVRFLTLVGVLMSSRKRREGVGEGKVTRGKPYEDECSASRGKNWE